MKINFKTIPQVIFHKILLVNNHNVIPLQNRSNNKIFMLFEIIALQFIKIFFSWNQTFFLL